MTKQYRRKSTTRPRGLRLQGHSHSQGWESSTSVGKLKQIFQNPGVLTLMCLVLASAVAVKYYQFIITNDPNLEPAFLMEELSEDDEDFDKENAEILEEEHYAKSYIRLVELGLEYFNQTSAMDKHIENALEKLEGPDLSAFQLDCDEYTKLYSGIKVKFAHVGSIETSPEEDAKSLSSVTEFAVKLRLRFEKMRTHLVDDMMQLENMTRKAENLRKELMAHIIEAKMPVEAVDHGALLSNNDDMKLHVERSIIYELGKETLQLLKQMASSIAKITELMSQIQTDHSRKSPTHRPTRVLIDLPEHIQNEEKLLEETRSRLLQITEESENFLVQIVCGFMESRPNNRFRKGYPHILKRCLNLKKLVHYEFSK